MTRRAGCPRSGRYRRSPLPYARWARDLRPTHACLPNGEASHRRAQRSRRDNSSSARPIRRSKARIATRMRLRSSGRGARRARHGANRSPREVVRKAKCFHLLVSRACHPHPAAVPARRRSPRRPAPLRPHSPRMRESQGHMARLAHLDAVLGVPGAGRDGVPPVDLDGGGVHPRPGLRHRRSVDSPAEGSPCLVRSSPRAPLASGRSRRTPGSPAPFRPQHARSAHTRSASWSSGSRSRASSASRKRARWIAA
jgi:hypothetical protein